MQVFLQVIFWCCALALGYSYLGYPLWLWYLSRGRKLDTLTYGVHDDWPQVSVLMAVHNEARVIQQKLDSLLSQAYPPEKLHFYIGSDNSTDDTNAILARQAQLDARLHVYPFTTRQGKPGLINQLAAYAMEARPAGPRHLLVITDASVMLTPEVVQRLSAHFLTPNLAIVDANMVHTGMQESGISRSENSYISLEGRIKHWESIVWKTMIGPFGGCYALRSDFFSPVPPTFLVDDFYITMRAFERGGLAISEPRAVCYEPVGHEIREEFRRKARISAGNFQNLFTFRRLWWPPWGLPNFPFFSHKVLRWLGPFLLLALAASAGLLAALSVNLFYQVAFVLLWCMLFLVPLLDICLRQWGVHSLPLRHIRYFLLMNLALLVGFFRFLKGIRTNVWQPPKRQ